MSLDTLLLVPFYVAHLQLFSITVLHVQLSRNLRATRVAFLRHVA